MLLITFAPLPPADITEDVPHEVVFTSGVLKVPMFSPEQQFLQAALDAREKTEDIDYEEVKPKELPFDKTESHI